MSTDHYLFRVSRAGVIEYIVRAKGDGGKDWEWTQDPKLKRPMSPYWTRRFRAEMRDLGYTHGATPIA